MNLIGAAAVCLTVYAGVMFAHVTYDTNQQVNDHIIRHINDRQDIPTLKARLSYMRPGVRLNATRILQCLSSKLSRSNARYCLDVLIVLREYCPTPDQFNPTELLKTAITESAKPSDIKALLAALSGHSIHFVLNATQIWDCLSSKLSSSNVRYCLDVLDVLKEYSITTDHFNPTALLEAAIAKRDKLEDLEALLAELLKAAIAERCKFGDLQAFLAALPDGSMDPTSIIASVLNQDTYFEFHCGVLSRCITNHTKWNIKLNEIKIEDEMLVHAIVSRQYVTHFKLFRDLHAAGYDFNTKSSANKDIDEAYISRTKSQEMQKKIRDWSDNCDLISEWVQEAKGEPVVKEQQKTSKNSKEKKRSKSVAGLSENSPSSSSKKMKTESSTFSITPTVASVHVHVTLPGNFAVEKFQFSSGG